MLLFGLRMFERIQQFLVRGGLLFIRGLVYLKPRIGRIGRFFLAPFLPVMRLLFSFLVLPAFHGILMVRRALSRAWKPAKNKMLFLITNRYSIHAVMVSVVVVVGVLNLQTNAVRAETFGEKSLMLALVSSEDHTLIEEYATDPSLSAVSRATYESGVLSDAYAGIEHELAYEENPMLLGATLTATVSPEGVAASVAPRDSVETYTVETGDTLSTIASKFGISVNTLLWANNLSVKSTIRPGNTLVILPVSGVQHAVKKGDTLGKISSTYNVSSEEILAYNNMGSADDLSVGEKLIIPGGKVQAPAPPSRSNAIGKVFSTPSTSSNASPSRAGSGTMIWPTDLRIITQYYGARHTGIDVDCKFDNNNYAADDGIVSYSGWKSGYGYTVEINHGNGLWTRYGHHAKLYVSGGQQVTKGQSIGLCGTTGYSTGTHLHFEVFSGSAMVPGARRNPLEYIR